MKKENPFKLTFCDGHSMRREHQPKISKPLEYLLILRAMIYCKLTGKLSYFILRHGYDDVTRKENDWMFLSHYLRSHEESQNADLMEKLRRHLLLRKYGREIKYMATTVNKTGFDNAPEDIKEYMIKWRAYTPVHPFFVEYIHGMTRDRFLEYESGIYT